MEARSIPIQVKWAPRRTKDDALFYVGKSWEASVKMLDGNRVELFSTRVQVGPIRILLGAYPNQGFEQIAANQ